MHATKGNTTSAGKDPYSTKFIFEEVDKKRAVRLKDFKLPNQQNQSVAENSLKFECNFECGNLHSAIKISSTEYHLFIHPDTNTGGHTQWFYFKVSGMQKELEYTFKIMNFNKKHSAFQKGMSPCVFSTKNWDVTGKGWDITETYNVDYCYNPFNKAMNTVDKKKYENKYAPLGKDGKKLKKTTEDTHNARAKKLYALAFSYK